MSQPPILSYEGLFIHQGEGMLFRDLDIHVGPRDRLALIGRNGAGKTTLLRLLADQIEADKGQRTIQPGTNIVMLEQEPDFAPFETLLDFAVSGEKG
ncbi:MAG: ATP-binding cassette domain-containing protein, partial [Pseudomonadota bacterium]